MYSCQLTLELNENMEADVTVYFSVDSPGYAGDHLDPPELPEFYVIEMRLETVYGFGYQKSSNDLLDGGWWGIANRAAERALENYDEIYEHQYDAYCGAYDD